MSGRTGCKLLGVKPGVHKDLNRETEKHRILESFDVLDVPGDIRKLIVEALLSDKWDWFKDCDGCTAVSEVYWPTIYFPPCLRHDYDCTINPSERMAANNRFYRIQRAYGMSAFRAGARWVGVTVAWGCWIKWANMWRARK
jgi:hypothetical protein